MKFAYRVHGSSYRHRLRDPSNRPHQVSDDLESFFWVLLYLVVKCRNSTGEDLSEDMKDIFDQHAVMNHNGEIKGGKGKRSCLHNVLLDSTTIETLANTPCGIIIEELRSLFCLANHSIRGADPLHLIFESKWQEAVEKLSSSKWMLEMINEHPSSKWDVDDAVVYTRPFFVQIPRRAGIAASGVRLKMATKRR